MIAADARRRYGGRSRDRRAIEAAIQRYRQRNPAMTLTARPSIRSLSSATASTSTLAGSVATYFASACCWQAAAGWRASRDRLDAAAGDARADRRRPIPLSPPDIAARRADFRRRTACAVTARAAKATANWCRAGRCRRRSISPTRRPPPTSARHLVQHHHQRQHRTPDAALARRAERRAALGCRAVHLHAAHTRRIRSRAGSDLLDANCAGCDCAVT